MLRDLMTERRPYGESDEPWQRGFGGGSEKVLLREVNYCPQCGENYLSLYRLRLCSDHAGLEKI